MSQTNISPELSGLYECQSCKNTERFEGTDSDGYGGRESCENNHEEPCTEDFCECETALVQDFTAPAHEMGTPISNDDIDYDRFEGGSSGAVIDSYDRIVCRDCREVIWDENAEVPA